MPSTGGRIERAAVLGQAGGDVGVMMLHLDQRQRLSVGALARELRRQIFRMQVGDERDRRVIEQLCVEREAVR